MHSFSYQSSDDKGLHTHLNIMFAILVVLLGLHIRLLPDSASMPIDDCNFSLVVLAPLVIWWGGHTLVVVLKYILVFVPARGCYSAHIGVILLAMILPSF